MASAALSAVLAGVAAALLFPDRARSRPAPAVTAPRAPSDAVVTGARAPSGAATSMRPEAAPGTGVRLVAALGAGTGAALLVGGWLGVVLGVGTALAGWRYVGGLEPASRRRRRILVRARLPLVVDLVAACLHAGHPPATAIAAVARSVEPGPMADELDLVVARLGLGGDPQTTWRDLGRHPELGPLGRCIARALDSGASVASALEDLAGDVRRDHRADVLSRARAVGARAAAPLGLCFLPAFVLVGVVPLVVGSLSGLLGD